MKAPLEALNPQLDVLGQQLADAKIRNIASVVAPSVSQRPELFEATWYTEAISGMLPSRPGAKGCIPARSSPRT
ncbi:MAG TPA: hypothetical protein VGA51_03685 [Casimicrobiaceae bacterium]